MKTWIKPTQHDIDVLVQRPSMDVSSLEATVNLIFSAVQENGDTAVKSFTEKFDKILLDELLVSEAELKGAENALPINLRTAILQAYKNIYTFHETQKSSTVIVETMPGVECWQKSIPITTVGLYIPGGTAPLFSTVLMLGIPAKIAGCKEIVLCSPPDAFGIINPAILFAAKLCGVTKIVKVGGAQAIAGMSIGTETIPKVDKIFGPGNQYVTAAKIKSFQNGTAIDMPAGPSEVLVFADDTADASFIASDLLSQAEHGVDSQVILVTTSKSLIEKTQTEIQKQLAVLPRKDMAKVALDHSHSVCFDSVEESFAFINTYAPEHFIISSDHAEQYYDLVENAGSVFVGHFTPESAGDYASGTNHTLPTNGFAKAFSGVNLDAYVKKVTFQKISESGIQNIGQTIITMAEAEQLQGHANAVKLRMKDRVS